jgi:protein-disulfide isomerase
MRGLLTAAGLAVAAISGAVPPAVTAAAQQRDWTKVVAATPEGGFRVGNPAAPLKLIEYGSLTCNHCGQFATQGYPQLLARYVKSGRLSFEFRNFVRDPADLSAALLSRCAGPAGFFALTDRYFANQSSWIGRYQAMGDAQKKKIDTLPDDRKLVEFAAVGGLTAMAAQGGVPAARAAQCLADKIELNRLIRMREIAGQTYKVEGTPTFILNGKKLEAHDWTALQPLLGPPAG